MNRVTRYMEEWWKNHRFPEPEDEWDRMSLEYVKEADEYWRKELRETLPGRSDERLRRMAKIYKKSMDLRTVALIARPMVQEEFRRRALARARNDGAT